MSDRIILGLMATGYGALFGGLIAALGGFSNQNLNGGGLGMFLGCVICGWVLSPLLDWWVS